VTSPRARFPAWRMGESSRGEPGPGAGRWVPLLQRSVAEKGAWLPARRATGMHDSGSSARPRPHSITGIAKLRWHEAESVDVRRVSGRRRACPIVGRAGRDDRPRGNGHRPGGPAGGNVAGVSNARQPPMLPQRRPSMKKPPLPMSSGAGGTYISAPASTASLVATVCDPHYYKKDNVHDLPEVCYPNWPREDDDLSLVGKQTWKVQMKCLGSMTWMIYKCPHSTAQHPAGAAENLV